MFQVSAALLFFQSVLGLPDIVAPPPRPTNYSYSVTGDGYDSLYAVIHPTGTSTNGRMRLVQFSTSTPIQNQNFTIACSQSINYRTGYEGHTGNWTLHCFPREFSGSCDSQIAAYDMLMWPNSSYVLLQKSAICQTARAHKASSLRQVACDIFGPPGGDPNRTSFAFKAGTSIPLYSKGCYPNEPWCSIVFYDNWQQGSMSPEKLACDSVCTSLGCD